MCFTRGLKKGQAPLLRNRLPCVLICCRFCTIRRTSLMVSWVILCFSLHSCPLVSAYIVSTSIGVAPVAASRDPRTSKILRISVLHVFNLAAWSSQSSMTGPSLSIGTHLGYKIRPSNCLLACGLSGSNLDVNLRQASSPKDLLLFFTIASASLPILHDEIKMTHSYVFICSGAGYSAFDGLIGQ